MHVNVTFVEQNNTFSAEFGETVPVTCWEDLEARIDKLEQEQLEKQPKIPSPDKATVGQTIRVSAVDDNGKPTEWEAYSVKISSTSFFATNFWISYEEIPAKTMKMKLEGELSLPDPISGGSYITVNTSQIKRFPSLWFVTEVSRDGLNKWYATLYVYNFGDEDVTLFEEEITIFPIETYAE